MNKQDEAKAEHIAERLCRFYGKEYDSFKECKESALEMAAWKEQQMIERACKWIDENLTNYITLGDDICPNIRSITLRRDFKQAMRED